MDKEFLTKQYNESLGRHEAEARRLRLCGRRLVVVQLVLFVGAIGCAVGYTLTVGLGLAWTLLGVALLAGYALARRADGVNSERLAKEESLCAVYRKELAWLSGDYSAFDDGARYADPRHDYAFDMDIFGQQGLYHRLCRCVTKGGADRLAHLLATCALGGATKAEIDARREAVEELVNKEKWRTDFMSYGANGQIDTDKVAQSMAAIRSISVGGWLAGTVSLALAWAVILAFYSLILLAIFTPMSASVPVWWGIGMFCAAYSLCKIPFQRASKAIGKSFELFRAYADLIESIVRLDVSTADNRRLKAVLGDEGEGALASFSELGAILKALDSRSNVLGMVLSDVLFLNDVFLLRRFLRWQRRYAGEMEAWLEAVGEMDARVSMATFCYGNPGLMSAPDVVEGSDVVFEAHGLTHPFLGDKAVPNDVALLDGHFYIVTGANMAGKSTFLRSLGVNYILCMAGMPVFARSFRVSVFALFSSMRTSDDLAHGISYFNAELLRLRQLLDRCRRNPRTLIILDEILKGTNSLDKLNGSRMFLEAVAKLPVTGVIATHDLELSKMADASPARFHNLCFEIGLADKITYTYKLTPGVARNQNATFLLRGIIGG